MTQWYIVYVCGSGRDCCKSCQKSDLLNMLNISIHNVLYIYAIRYYKVEHFSVHFKIAFHVYCSIYCTLRKKNPQFGCVLWIMWSCRPHDQYNCEYANTMQLSWINILQLWDYCEAVLIQYRSRPLKSIFFYQFKLL